VNAFKERENRSVLSPSSSIDLFAAFIFGIKINSFTHTIKITWRIFAHGIPDQSAASEQ
jgi:hypothetical protein